MYSDVDFVIQKRAGDVWVIIEKNNLDTIWTNVRIEGTLEKHDVLWFWGTARLLVWNRVKPWAWPSGWSGKIEAEQRRSHAASI